MARELDISSSSTDERLDKIVSEFNTLQDEETLLVSCNEDFFSAIADMQEQLKDQFIWSPWLNGPAVWKGELLKRSDNIHNSIVEFMTFDHKRCDELYADAEAAGNEGNWELASELLKAFNLGMYRHLGMEENMLFTAFTEATGIIGGPVQVMIMEHDQMRGTLKQMMDAVDEDDSDSAFAVGDTMVILMQQHNVKEEGILYPMIGQHMPDAGGMIRRMQLYMAP